MDGISDQGQKNFRIILVGFANQSAEDASSPLVDTIHGLIPEATFVQHDIHEHHVEDSVVFDGYFLSDWILKKAEVLLEKTDREILQGNGINHDDYKGELLFAGSGIGGLVVKQAIITANTNPEFYHLASRISSLVFVDTPHMSTNQQPWEGLLLGLIETTPSRSLRERLYKVVSGLASHVSDLSESFLKFVPKYRVLNLVFELREKERAPDENTGAGGNTSDGESLEAPYQWTENVKIQSSFVDDLQSLEVLRKCFAPSWHTEANLTHDDEYFAALRVLSRSMRVIYETGTALDNVDDMRNLAEVYGSELHHIRFHDVRGRCIQVTAASGHGRSAIVKLVSQHLRAEFSSLVVINNFTGSFLVDVKRSVSFYGILISTLHQVLSQKPTLFTPTVRTLMYELLQKNVWTEELAQRVLEVIFTQSNGTDFLLTIHDHDSLVWPDAAKRWWHGLSELFANSVSSEKVGEARSSCTVLLSTDQQDGSHSIPFIVGHRLDLMSNYRERKAEFIRKEFHRLLATGTASVTSGLLRHKQGDSIRDVVIGKAMKFTGSFSEISCYISHLLQCFSCSAPAVIRQGIGRTPDTAGEFYRKRISLVNNTDNELRDWATSALSWVFLAARPLRIEELARATAIHPSRGGSNLRDIEEESTLDTQQDIRNNLSGFLCVEDGFVRIANPIARAVLREGTPYNAEQHRVTGRNGSISIGTRAALELLGDGDLVERCLTYLALLLSEQPEPSPIQEPFVDYAVRYWPTHFARIQDPGEDLCGQVVTFLRNSPVANGWFRLYLNWNSLSVTTLLDDEPTPSNVDRHTDSSGAKGTISPAVMASCVGLSQVMAQLLEGGDLEAENSEDGFLPTVLMKRGSLETQLAFRDAANCKLYLECAIAANNLSLVEMLLGNDKLQSGGRIISYQLMHMAARSGGLEMVKMLSQHPEVVQTSFHGDAEGRTAFHRAAARGHCNIIDHILISTRNHDGFGSADMSSLHMHPDHKGQTALTLALRGGNTDAALLLVQRAETDVPHNNLVNNLVNIPDNDGRTPIHHAVISSPLFLDKYMVEINRPAELEELLVTSDNSGLTPLHLAAREGCVEAICIILDFATRSDIANVVLLARDNRDQFPLHHAIQHGQSEIVGLLHELRTKGHASTCDYWYPLPDNLDGYITPEDLSAQQGQLDTLIKLHAGTANLTQSLLSAAAGAGQLLIVKYLLQHGLDPNMSSETSDDTPLGLAAAGGFTTVVRFLLDKGADINLADGGRKSPLYLAVENKRMEVVQALLNYHSPTRGSSPASPRSDSEDEQETSYFGHIIVDAPDSSRLTPLHVAASQGNTNLVSLLMKFGANVDSKSAELKTPLHLAVENNQLDVASLLVDKYGASISAQDEDGLHPVDYAIRKCQKDMFEVLIGYAADVERESTSADSRDTVYTVELQRRDLVTAIQCSAVDIVRLIVEQFSGIEDDCENRDSVLHIAARDSDGEMIKVLRNHFRGFDVNRTGSQGRTPIHAAVAHKNLEALKELLKVEPNLEQADDDGKTPLLLAVGKGMPPEICRVLLNKGARVDNLGPRGRGLTPLHIAAIHGNLPVMSELLKENPPLEAENDDHETPLLLCVGRGMDPGACKLLLEHGAQVNNAGKKNAQSPLYKAAYQGNPDTVEVLLQHAADVKWQDNGLWTALHAAMDNLAICRSLVEHGADLDAKKNDDWTPLHLGCYWSMPETVKLLLEKGAAPNPKNDDGNTPLHLALEMESLPVLQVMINHNVTCSTEYDNLRNPVDFGLPGAGGFLPIQVAIKQRSSEIKKVLLSVLRPREKDKNGSDYLDLALLKSDPAMLLFLLDEVEWDHDDIIRAYRRAIQEDTLSCFDVLVGKHSWLLKEEIADATHRVSGVDIRMLRELDLLIRNDSSSKLDYLVQRYLKRPCESDSPGSDKISDSTFDPTFRKLRLATELKTSVHWDALVSGARAQIDCDARDQDGWTIDDFIHQSRARLKLSVDDNQRPVRGTASSPTAMLLPRAWHRDGEQYDSRVEIGQDGLCITFHGGGWSSLPLCLRSDHPFAPYSRNAAYFEVKFESSNMNGMDGPSESMISVGLCGELADMTGAHSGWRPLSVGYHSDNGGLYLENGHRDTIHEKYGLGSTVGCGIDYETEELFFTLDGKIMIQRKCPNLIFRKLYPCVAQSYREAKVTVNFGSEKFAWEGANRRATRGISSGASVRVGRMSRVIQRRPTNLGPE